MPKNAFLLRVEAVNLSSFISDNQDLSTIRGGSLLLLNAPDLIASPNPSISLLTQAGAENIEIITKGASQALIRFETDDLKAAQAIGAKLAKLLRMDAHYQHATFVVDVVEQSSSLPGDRERLLALNRFRQGRQARLVPPAWNEQVNATGDWPYCGIDFTRPAKQNNHVPNDDKRRVSESVFVRAKYGRDQKQQFYAPYLPTDWPEQRRRFAQHFHEIAADPPDEYRKLGDKLALIYVDGNSFGKKQRDNCQTAELQRKFDELVQQSLRGRALRALLNQAHQNESWRGLPGRDGKEIVRLETMLWGGDELIWVVPAWKGWETVRLFYNEIAAHYGIAPPPFPLPDSVEAGPVLPPTNIGRMRNLSSPRRPPRQAEPVKPAEEVNATLRLTHAAGIVFCHANSPIHRIRELAEKLANQAKSVTRDADALAYMVMESFDHLSGDLEDARARHLPYGCNVNDLVINAMDLQNLTSDLETMIATFPHGAVYRLLRELRSPPPTDETTRQKSFSWWLKRAEREMDGPVPIRFKGCRPEGGASRPDKNGCASWMHLAELWDYITKKPQSTARP
jgi:hypothetical protein